MASRSKPVTPAELTKVAENFFDLQQDLVELARRLESTYMADNPPPAAQTLMSFSALARAADDVVRLGLAKIALAEDKRQTEAMLRERIKDDAKS